MFRSDVLLNLYAHISVTNNDVVNESVARFLELN